MRMNPCHAPFTIGDLLSIANPTCVPRAWQLLLPTPCSAAKPWLPAPVLPLQYVLTQIFHMPQLLLTAWWDEQPQGKMLILTAPPVPQDCGPGSPSSKSPPLWLQACSYQHPRLMKPNGLCAAMFLPWCCRSLCPCHCFLT